MWREDGEFRQLTSMATDPVCGMPVDETEAVRATVGGRTLGFCSPHCRAEYLRAPDAFPCTCRLIARSGVDLALVEQAATALFEESDPHRARALLEQAVGAQPHIGLEDPAPIRQTRPAPEPGMAGRHGISAHPTIPRTGEPAGPFSRHLGRLGAFTLVLIGALGVLAVLYPPGVGPTPVEGIEITRTCLRPKPPGAGGGAPSEHAAVDAPASGPRARLLDRPGARPTEPLDAGLGRVTPDHRPHPTGRHGVQQWEDTVSSSDKV